MYRILETGTLPALKVPNPKNVDKEFTESNSDLFLPPSLPNRNIFPPACKFMFVADARDSFASSLSLSDWNTSSAAGETIDSKRRHSGSQRDSESPAGDDHPQPPATPPDDIRTPSKAVTAPAQSDVTSSNRHGTEVLRSAGGVSSVSGGVVCVDMECEDKEEVSVRDDEVPSSSRPARGRSPKPFRCELYVVSGENRPNTRWQ